MSIDSTQPTTPISGIASATEMRTRTAPQDNSPTQGNAGEESKTAVTLSALTRQIQSDDNRDVNYARVAEIRAALAAGELPLEPEKIAQALVQEMFQFH
ncbi:flagellar biosynthesis anti-sigma factor FlgM [Scandinavium goeteborgense]|uniref:Negative regulator of flagellin synthesis n=1 Tax=Scandinavium goeteborgense TaxID=1851514 RepID=A0A4R6ENA5_SCAGO|nr:flagellar biosynthesis anti-sigma factor FlgM [Scandinavium goeteborgense]TDN59443.1 FlgM family anti-sigma-28 factor [Scandinavium goeteborgense]